MHVCGLSRFRHAQLCAMLWSIARQAPLSMGFFRQEYWSGLPCPPTGDLPDSGIKPASLIAPALAGMFFVVVQSLSQKIKICVCDPKDCNTPGFPLLKLMSIELMMLSNHLILCCPLLLPSIFPRIRVFSSESALRIR